MQSMPKVNILLSTYNGVKHLSKQLKSIERQSYKNFDLYIRDDHSHDETLEYIRAYAKSITQFRVIILENHGKNLGVPASFYDMLHHCEPADYYAFCDQDDIWYKDKIKKGVAALERKSNSERGKSIRLYYSAYDYYTDSNAYIRSSPVQGDNLTLSDVLYYTPGSGFVILINEAARQELCLKVNPGNELHDRWLIRGATCFGDVIYDKSSTASHIRHEEAVTAGDSTMISQILYFMKKELFGNQSKIEKYHLTYFLEEFRKQLSKEQRELLELFTYVGANPIVWIRKVFYPKRLRARLLGEVALRILFFTGRL